MSSIWSWFVILGTIGTLIFAAVFLLMNRTISGEETTGHDYDGIQELDNPLPFWWVGMFLITIVYAAAYLIYYPGLGNYEGIVGWTSTEQWQQEVDRHEERFAPIYEELAAMSADELANDRAAQQIGRRLFINHCSACHGVSATGSLGFPNLADTEWIWGSGFDNIKQAIVNGRNAVMPPWGAALGDEGVADVTQYTLSLAGLAHDAEAAERGRTRYAALCVACHGPEGRGNPALGAPDLTNDIWLYGRSAEEIAITIRNGRNGIMPAFGDQIGANKAHALAGYVNALGTD
jgi:cytochrome c oxidase cbb3-type subunit 3